MFRQRLFWKLFLSFWLALLLFAIGVLYAASAYLEATRLRYDAPNNRERGDPTFNVAQAAADAGLAELQNWARHADDSELVPMLVLNAQEKDILGRDPSSRALARLAFTLKNYKEDQEKGRPSRRQPIVLPDGQEYWLVPDFQSATLSRLILRPRVVATQLILATLIGAAVCLALAAYLTFPLRRLREASVAYGSGDFSQATQRKGQIGRECQADGSADERGEYQLGGDHARA